MYTCAHTYTYTYTRTHVAAGDNAAFSRERKDMRENFDKEAKAMKRQIEVLQVGVGARGRVHGWRVGAPVDA